MYLVHMEGKANDEGKAGDQPPAEPKAVAIARQLDAAQAITHIGSWEWDVASGAVVWSDELYRIYGFEPRSRAITLDLFITALHPDDRAFVQGEINAAMQRGGRFAWRERIVRPDGEIRVLETVGEVLPGPDGRPAGLIGTCRDVTEEQQLAFERTRAARVQAGEREALEQLTAGVPLRDVLATIVLLIEELSPGAYASILLLDASGKHLLLGAAPNLPAEYSQAIDGAEIGPRAGSCGTSAFSNEPVIVVDVEVDPLWADYRHLVRQWGLRACWSFPIRSSDGRVLGTFALYYRVSRGPRPDELELIERAAHVSGIAIERRQLDEQQRDLSARIEEVREEERTSIAREIHDELGQALTALKLDLAWIKRRSGNGDDVRAKLDDMSRATDEIIHTVRRISAELRPQILDDVGLRAALEWQADEFTRHSGVPCHVTANIGDLRLDKDLATAVFRIFQEALTNIARHARATRVDVHLRLERGQLKLDIIDDGVGVPEIAPYSATLGLLGMRERARRAGGDCTIRRREPQGTIVALTVPLRFPAARDEELGA